VADLAGRRLASVASRGSQARRDGIWLMASKHSAGTHLSAMTQESLQGGKPSVFHEQLEVASRGKALAQLPRADCGNGNAQVLGHFSAGIWFFRASW